jgi:hypothetical protein
MDKNYVRNIALSHMNEIMEQMWVYNDEDANTKKVVIFKNDDGIVVAQASIDSYISFSLYNKFEVSVRCRNLYDYLTDDVGIDDVTLYHVKNTILAEINDLLDEVE